MVLYIQCHFIIPKSKQVHAYKEAMIMVTGAELFVKALRAEQVDTLFAYPADRQLTCLMPFTVSRILMLFCRGMSRD